jgi:drug/metabolite transporter (DMT)-like permease
MFLAIVLGLIGMIVLHIGIGVQKMGVAAMSGHEKGSAEAKRGFRIWLGGIAITGLGAVCNFVALMFELSASSLAVFSGIGLLALVIFAQFFLEEVVGRAEIGALILILLGTALGGIPVSPGVAAESAMFYLFAVSLTAMAVAFLVTIVGPWTYRELCQGGLSGVLGGLAINVQKELAGPEVNSHSLYFVVLWAGLTLGAFTIVNLAFRKERAVVLVPLGASCSVVTGVLVGFSIQGEGLSYLHWLGMVLTILGVYLMARTAISEFS